MDDDTVPRNGTRSPRVNKANERYATYNLCSQLEKFRTVLTPPFQIGCVCESQGMSVNQSHLTPDLQSNNDTTPS